MGSEARTLTAENAHEISEWCGGMVVQEHDALDHSKIQPGVNLQCGDEVKRASVGDMVIRLHDGTFELYKKRY